MYPVGFDYIPNARNARELLETSLDVSLDIVEVKNP